MTLFGLPKADAAFEGRTIESGGAPLRYEVEQAGRLMIRSPSLFRRLLGVSQLVACDPWVPALNPGPILDYVPAGKHPVSVAYAHLADGECRVAFVRVQFSDEKVVGWRHAVSESEDGRRRRGESFGYGVDSAFGCVMGLDAAAHLARRLQDESDTLESQVLSAMAPTTGGGGSWAFVEVSPDCPENLFVVNSGFGDGSYRTYFGEDSHGSIACLITDFNVGNRAPRPGQAAMEMLARYTPLLKAMQRAREAAKDPPAGK
jgi:hypothetical protein